ncbi:MAG: macro domain-containing protein [Balneolaceae bacterium]
MTKIQFNHVQLELVQGDIVDQHDCGAIVNAANAQLVMGGGVAGAIHRIGDPQLQKETRPLAPISPGEAVITSAPNFPNDYIIHCLGPVYGRDKPEDTLLRNCYINALKLADDHHVEMIAFPSISTGAFGYPMKEAAEIAFRIVKEYSNKLKSVRVVRFVLWSPADFNLHLDVLKKI